MSDASTEPENELENERERDQDETVSDLDAPESAASDVTGGMKRGVDTLP